MELSIYRCLRCGHYWTKTTGSRQPGRCPKCKTKHWDTPWNLKPQKGQKENDNDNVKRRS